MLRRGGNKKPRHAKPKDAPPEAEPARPVLPPPEPRLPEPLNMNHEMAKRHEAFLARVFKGRQMKGSGNQQSGQMDGRHDTHRQSFAFAWDGKSTFGASIMVSRRMWEKAQDQSHFERPLIALRFYANFRLQDSEALDLAVVSAHDLAEVLDRLEELEAHYAAQVIRGTSSVTTVKTAQATEPFEPPSAGPPHQ
jgi:hypothetical protein